MNHINPKGFEKMNVPLAMQVKIVLPFDAQISETDLRLKCSTEFYVMLQLFSEKVQAAMQTLKNEPNCPGLKDCDATLVFMSRVDKLIKAMMSRTPPTALRKTDTNASKLVF